MEMKIEWAVGLHLESKESSEWHIPVVRLHEVDQVIAEAVWAMEWLEEEGPSGPMGNRGYQRAEAFLASDLVAQWRDRQEEGKKS